MNTDEIPSLIQKKEFQYNFRTKNYTPSGIKKAIITHLLT